MLAIVSLFVIVTLSLLVTRSAAVALTYTGLSYGRLDSPLLHLADSIPQSPPIHRCGIVPGAEAPLARPRRDVCWGPRLLCLAALVYSASNLPAQTFGEIAGFVRDASAGAVQGARVSATNESTNQFRTVETSASGSYSIPSLPPGPYTVLAEKQGFKSQLRSGVVLQVEDRARAERRRGKQILRNPQPTSRRRAHRATDFRGRAAATVHPFQPRRGRKHRRELQHLSRQTPIRRPARVQGADRRLWGGARPRYLANHCHHQIGDK